MIRIKGPTAINKMREAGKIVARFHDEASRLIEAGRSVMEIERLAENICAEEGCRPSFLGYHGYPSLTCISINEVIIHGIPKESMVMAPGDLVSLDFAVEKNGYHADAATSWLVPGCDLAREKRVNRLIEISWKALEEGLARVKPGAMLGEVSVAIQKTVELAGFNVVRDFVGHGIGEQMHEAPQIPNFGKIQDGPRLKKGMTLAIEPMVVEGSAKVRVLDDDWTAVTVDGGLACHVEHTVLVIEGGYEILTRK